MIIQSLHPQRCGFSFPGCRPGGLGPNSGLREPCAPEVLEQLDDITSNSASLDYLAARAGYMKLTLGASTG